MEAMVMEERDGGGGSDTPDSGLRIFQICFYYPLYLSIFSFSLFLFGSYLFARRVIRLSIRVSLGIST